MYWNKKSVECTFFLINQPFATPKYMYLVGKSQLCFNCRVKCLGTNDSKTATNTALQNPKTSITEKKILHSVQRSRVNDR